MVKGIAALHRRFEAIPKRIIAAVTVPMEKYADQIVAMMKVLVPVDQGDLRDSIGWTWGDAPKGSVKIGTMKGHSYGKIALTIYAGGPTTTVGARGQFNTALLQEFGTQNMPANPYFYVSWRANKRRVKSGITRAIRKAIKES